MKKKQNKVSSGIGGQAVLEGIMMKNKEEYAVAVRKTNGEIVVETAEYDGIVHGTILTKIPFIRGIFNFIDSLVLGMRTLTLSASYFDDEAAKPTVTDKAMKVVFREKAEKVLMGLTVLVSIVIAIAVFMLLPYFLSQLCARYVVSDSLLAILEGIFRIVIFVIYISSISLMKDIRRVYMYHGAEHKCINCIERGKPLTVKNVMRSSKQHRRCGTSFMLFVVVISVILFFFIRVDTVFLRVVIRVALVPLIAGIAYEIIRLAGRSNNFLVRIISAPGMWLQRLTTREPDEQMAEVAIAAVEAVFDWKQYLKDNFGIEEDEL